MNLLPKVKKCTKRYFYRLILLFSIFPLILYPTKYIDLWYFSWVWPIYLSFLVFSHFFFFLTQSLHARFSLFSFFFNLTLFLEIPISQYIEINFIQIIGLGTAVCPTVFTIIYIINQWVIYTLVYLTEFLSLEFIWFRIFYIYILVVMRNHGHIHLYF